MRKINELSEILINQIAAGEVIDRPASIIKELVENSIDAGADQISISFSDGGISQIIIDDNGSGISEEDIELAFKKHATSKIKDVNDLYNINTLGFRGEALSSISSISEVTVETKTQEMEIGMRYKIENSKVVKRNICNKEQGTKIIVENLFYNVPARRKFLKSIVTEKNHCINEINNLLLFHNQVEFKVVVDNKVIFNLSKKSKIDRYNEVLGTNSENFIVLEDLDKIFSMHGYLSLPQYCSTKRGSEYLYVNGRQIKDPIVKKAIQNAYSGLIPSNNFPQYVFSIQLDPKIIDVNVHPKKLEVKWEDSSVVFSKVSKSVRGILEKQLKNMVKKSIINLEPTSSSATNYNTFSLDEQVNEKPVYSERFEVSDNYYRNNSSFSKPRSQDETKEYIDFTKELFETVPNNQEEIVTSYSSASQLLDTYLILQYTDKIQIIDQHAAAERIKYDKLLKIYSSNLPSDSQELLVPIKLDFRKDQSIIFAHITTLLDRFGIIVEKYGDNYMVKSFPNVIFSDSLEQIIYEIIELFIDSGETFESEIFVEKYLDKIISKMACHNSIRAGYSMNRVEIDWLISELYKTEKPYSCPHGRPIIWEITKKDLEKTFGRVK